MDFAIGRVCFVGGVRTTAPHVPVGKTKVTTRFGVDGGGVGEGGYKTAAFGLWLILSAAV